MNSLRCRYNLRPHEWCPADHVSAATLAIANTALEAPGHTSGKRPVGGSSPLVCLQGQGALAAALSARPRDKCDLCGRTQVDNVGPHIYGHCANPWLREARRSWHIRTNERHPQALRRGPRRRTPSGATSRTRTRSSTPLRLQLPSATSHRAVWLSRAQADAAAPTEWPGGL